MKGKYSALGICFTHSSVSKTFLMFSFFCLPIGECSEVTLLWLQRVLVNMEFLHTEVTKLIRHTESQLKVSFVFFILFFAHWSHYTFILLPYAVNKVDYSKTCFLGVIRSKKVWFKHKSLLTLDTGVGVEILVISGNLTCEKCAGWVKKGNRCKSCAEHVMLLRFFFFPS